VYLSREQAVAELVRSGSTEDSAGKLLDSALAVYPRSHRTNFDMITGFPARVWSAPFSQVDRFTICPW